MTNNGKQFITFFENCRFRYLDLTRSGREPISSDVQRPDLNESGYCAFFTPNGFLGEKNTKDNCVNLNSFYIDIDEKISEERMAEIKSKFNPTFIVETKNGYHFYWLLDEPIFKDEVDDWEEQLDRWQKVEKAIVDGIPEADNAVKDVTRILRIPDSFYWKKTGDDWKEGTGGAFQIKGIYKDTSQTYSMDDIESIFQVEEDTQLLSELNEPNNKNKTLAEVERNSFFERVNEEYPIAERDSFKKLIGNNQESLHPAVQRNNTLHITACLMRQAGWSLDKALKHIDKVGWHGMESEPGGKNEILNTIKSAFSGNYTYSYKNEVIAFNTTPIESQKLRQAHLTVMKERKEQDKVRFSTYENEILTKHPHLRKNDIGIIFRYDKGVYKMMSDQEVSDMILNDLYDDMLWGYRTKRNVSDKVACLLSIIPPLELSDDKGYIANVKNGLLNIYTKELLPHTPDFVSLIQYPVEFDPSAKCPTWDKCLQDWMSGPEQKEKARMLQQFCGYCLSSSMLYDRALFMVGDGGNGKSTFIDTISMIIGPEATSHIDLESLYGQFGFKGLIGKRLNIIEEVHGNYYQSNKLKKLISGEQVTIDIKYKDQFTFRPQVKFVFSVNLLPRVDDTSTATERRILCLQFLNNYRDNPNYELRSSVGLLAKELPGILNWMVDGAIDLVNNGGFVTTKEQIRMLDEYREENSSVEGFLSQCVVLNEFSSIDTSTLYEEYKKWSNTDGGRKTKANITFTKEVKAYGAKNNRFSYKPRTSEVESRFVGIELSPQWIAKSANNGGLNNDPYWNK